MVLYTQKALDELARKRDQFAAYQSRHGDGLGDVSRRAGRVGDALSQRRRARRRTDRAGGGRRRAALGARPRQSTTPGCILRPAPRRRHLPTIPFGRSFAHHEQARAWAEMLRGVTTFAVDGSQLPPWRDASVPLALMQVGLFENPHQPPAPYIKDASGDILSPDELETAEPDAADGRSGEEFGYSDRITHLTPLRAGNRYDHRPHGETRRASPASRAYASLRRALPFPYL